MPEHATTRTHPPARPRATTAAHAAWCAFALVVIAVLAVADAAVHAGSVTLPGWVAAPLAVAATTAAAYRTGWLRRIRPPNL